MAINPCALHGNGVEDRGEYQYGGSIGICTTNGTPYVFINQLPEGNYHVENADNASWAPEARMAATLLGNAAASQVKSGVTFSSSNGIKLTGTNVVTITINVTHSWKSASGRNNVGVHITATASDGSSTSFNQEYGAGYPTGESHGDFGTSTITL